MFDTISDIVVQVTRKGGSGLLPDFERFDTVSEIAAAILNFIIGVAFSLSLLAVALAAVKYVLSGGDPEKTKSAWNAFLWGLIAGAISVGLIALKQIALGLFGIETTGITEVNF